MEETELDTLILDVFEKYETAAAKTKRQLTVRLPEQELPPCLCDPQRITQVLSILIDNALSYTPEDSRITLSLSASEHRFLLKVSDNGPGIPVQRIAAFRAVHHQVFDADVGEGAELLDSGLPSGAGRVEGIRATRGGRQHLSGDFRRGQDLPVIAASVFVSFYLVL